MKRQVFDLLPAGLEITEHQLGRFECCAKKQIGVFLIEVKAPVQYGAGVKKNLYLHMDQRVVPNNLKVVVYRID